MAEITESEMVTFARDYPDVVMPIQGGIRQGETVRVLVPGKKVFVNRFVNSSDTVDDWMEKEKLKELINRYVVVDEESYEDVLTLVKRFIKQNSMFVSLCACEKKKDYLKEIADNVDDYKVGHITKKGQPPLALAFYKIKDNHMFVYLLCGKKDACLSILLKRLVRSASLGNLDSVRVIALTDKAKAFFRRNKFHSESSSCWPGSSGTVHCGTALVLEL